MGTPKIYGEIEGIVYKTFLHSDLEDFEFDELDKALSKKGSFTLRIDDKNKFAVSWWLSPKRTRSYPYARVYDTLWFNGKRVTIIPIMKDEGKDGDRDFLQWDTISLMSLLGVYVILGYYVQADKNQNYTNKITNQRFNTKYLKCEIQRLLSYHSDALHWNLEQIDKVPQIAKLALKNYKKISKNLGLQMHSFKDAKKRINELSKGKEKFLELSRKLAQKAQKRESVTTQPKEHLEGIKGMITIKNYLGGYYYLTCDEVEIHDNDIYLIEGKHTKEGNLPSENDIKDGLIKMILFTNLKNVEVDDRKYYPIPVLKLTTKAEFKENLLSKSKSKFLSLLKKEAKHNGFRIKINDKFIV